MPAEWQTTGQLLLNTCMWSVGRTAGSLFGGLFYHHGTFLGEANGRALYLAAAVGGLAVLAVHTAITLLLRACGARGLYAPPPPPPPPPPLPPLLSDTVVDPLASVGEAPSANDGRSSSTASPGGRDARVAINT